MTRIKGLHGFSQDSIDSFPMPRASLWGGILRIGDEQDYFIPNHPKDPKDSFGFACFAVEINFDNSLPKESFGWALHWEKSLL